MKLRYILTEIANYPLYRFVSESQLSKIISSNSLSREFSTPVNLSNYKHEVHILSFTRNKNYNIIKLPIRITFDRLKLSNKYSLKPYSHYGIKALNRKLDESEEIIINPKPITISNIDKYIISIERRVNDKFVPIEFK